MFPLCAQHVVTDFTLPKHDGGELSIRSLKSSSAVVVLVLDAQCPYVKLYSGRIKQAVNTYASKGIKFVMISTNKNLNEMASELGIPYLIDANKSVIKQLGASKAPTAVVLQPKGANFVVRYQGAIDNNAQVEGDVSVFYLNNALDAILANKLPQKQHTRPIGCMIK